MVVAAVLTTVICAMIEVWLVGYAGWLVDALAATTAADRLRAEHAERSRVEHDRRVFAAARRAHLDLQRVEVTINSSMIALLVGLAGYGIMLWRTGAAPLGLVAAALALSFRLTAMAEWLLDAVSSLFQLVGALRQALPTVAQPLAVPDKPGSTPCPYGVERSVSSG